MLLDFFGIGTSPKKNYQLDPETELTFSANQQLDVRSFYENQPDAMINSEINFTVRSFALTFNKQEYKLLKANVAGLQSQIQIRGTSTVSTLRSRQCSVLTYIYIYIYFRIIIDLFVYRRHVESSWTTWKPLRV